MGRLLSIDYGMKRTGLAVTDGLQIIATALETVPTSKLMDFLKVYTQNEEVDSFIVGMPKNLDNKDTHTTEPVRKFGKQLTAVFPNIPLHWVDERYTSVMALRTMIDGGMKKKERRKKENVDKISATIILQSYMESKNL